MKRDRSQAFPHKTDPDMLSAPLKSPVLLGIIAGAHGIKGKVTLKSFTDPLEKIATYGEMYGLNPLTKQFWRDQITKIEISNKRIIAVFSKISTRSEAEQARGIHLYIERSELPETDPESVYHVDLIGLRVENKAGMVLGKIVSVVNYGASDLLEVTPSPEIFGLSSSPGDKKEADTFYIPLIRDFVLEINLSERYMIVELQDGLL